MNGKNVLPALTVRQQDRIYASPNDIEHAISVKLRIPMVAKLKVRPPMLSGRLRLVHTSQLLGCCSCCCSSSWCSWCWCLCWCVPVCLCVCVCACVRARAGLCPSCCQPSTREHGQHVSPARRPRHPRICTNCGGHGRPKRPCAVAASEVRVHCRVRWQGVEMLTPLCPCPMSVVASVCVLRGPSSPHGRHCQACPAFFSLCDAWTRRFRTAA